MTEEPITLDHGSGGEASCRLDDSAVLRPSPLPGQRLAFTTNSYVIDPPFFPGGNIDSPAAAAHEPHRRNALPSAADGRAVPANLLARRRTTSPPRTC